MHKKYIKKGGKTFGPYYYESYREDGKVKTRYVGNKEPLGLSKHVKKLNINWVKGSSPLILLVALTIAIVMLLPSNLENNVSENFFKEIGVNLHKSITGAAGAPAAPFQPQVVVEEEVAEGTSNSQQEILSPEPEIIMETQEEIIGILALVGNGNSSDPYNISNCVELNQTRDNLTAHYQLTTNIDCSDTINWYSGEGFGPIGNKTDEFFGDFDGQGYTITDLYINRVLEDNVGLFGYVGDGGNISNIGLIDVNVTGDDYVGGLVGSSYENVVINNSYCTGNVRAVGLSVGGLAGQNRYSAIRNSYFNGNVSGSSYYSGGLVGRNTYSTITDSYSTGNVEGSDNYVGGLVGYNNYDPGKIINSYSTSNVNGSGDYVGGFAGYNNAIINRSYSTGNVNGSGNVGGLVGYDAGGEIDSCFSTGDVNGSTDVHGMIGVNAGTLSNLYWNNKTGNPSNCHDVGNVGCVAIEDDETYFYDIDQPPMANWSYPPWSTQNNNTDFPILVWAEPSVINITDCGSLLLHNIQYYLTNEVSSTGSCFNIGVSNSTLDCQGNTITYGTSGVGFGINVTGAVNVSIKNCPIIKGAGEGERNYGLSVKESSLVNATNISITTAGTSDNYGIYLLNSDNNTVSYSNITANGSSSGNFGVYLHFSDFNNFSYNEISTDGSGGNDGVYIQGGSGGDYNELINNTIIIRGDTNTGVAILDSKFNIISNNIIDNFGIGQTNYGIDLESGSTHGNVLHGNRINSSSGQIGIGIRIRASNNSVTKNTVYIDGATENSNDGLYLDSAYSNNISDNTFFFEGNSADYGLYFAQSSNNTFFNNVFYGERKSSYIYTGIYSWRNNMTNTTFGTKESGVLVGSVRYPGLINVSNGTDVNLYEFNISTNRVFVNSSSIEYLNRSAEIILHNLEWNEPRVLVDYNDGGGAGICPAPQCNNLSYNGSTFVFNVSSFTTYKTEDASPIFIEINVSECGSLGIENVTYYVNTSVNSTGTCLTVEAANITIDCQGNFVNYSQSSTGYGITIGEFNYTLIRDCKFVQENSSVNESRGVYVSGGSKTNITGNTFESYGNYSYGISLESGGENEISFNNITTNGAEAYGVSLTGHDYGDVLNNIINTIGYSSLGINFYDGLNSSIESNNITTLGDYSLGVSSASSLYGEIIDNVFSTEGAYGYGMSLADCYNTSLLGNNITTLGDSGSGIFISTSNESLVEGNRVITYGIGSSGIVVDTSDDNWINDNYAESFGKQLHLIRVASGRYNLVTSNDLVNRADSSAAIASYGGSYNNFTDNDIVSYNQSASGLRLSNGASYELFQNNTILLNNTSNSGINIGASGYTEHNNSFIGNYFLINASSCNGIRIQYDGTQNYFTNNEVEIIAEGSNYIRMDSSTGDLNNFTNTTFSSFNGSVRFLESVEIPTSLMVNFDNLNIATNNIFLNSTNISFLNTSAEIILEELPWSMPQVLIDYNDDGDFELCNAPQCSNLSYNGGTGEFIFNVSSFTTYTTEETDYVPPLIIVDSPQNTTYAETTLDLNVSANDEMDSWWYSFDGGLANTSFTPNDTVTRSNGQHTLSVYANDTYGNVNLTAVTFVVDTTLPVMIIVYPQNANYNLNVDKLNYSYTEVNPDRCWYSINNGASNSSSVAMGVNFTSVTYSEGSNNWIVWCNDTAGNENLADVTFSIDTTFPQIQFEDPTPANSSKLSQDSLEANITFNDNSLDNVILRLYNSTGLVNLSISTVSPFYLNFTNLANEIYYLNATVNDTAENVNDTETRVITLDTGSPLIQFVDPTPVNGANLSQLNVAVNVTAVDGILDTVIVRIYNTTDLVNTTAGYTSPFYVNFTGLADGYYWFNATANDSASNVNITETRMVTLDTTPPWTIIISPENLTYNTHTLDFNVSSNEDLDFCKFTLNDWVTNHTMNAINATYFNYTNTTLGNYQYTARFWCNDTTGNVNVTESVVFSVDYKTITTCEGLQWMQYDLSANYTLGSNVDCSATSSWNSGAGFNPIGDSSSNFVGNFNGDNYNITDLYINLPGTNEVGLFGYANDINISNVGLLNVGVEGGDNVGGLVGSLVDGTIENSFSTGRVNSSAYNIGGLVGYGDGPEIINCYSTATAEGYEGIGGLIGYTENSGVINNSYATGSATAEGGDYAGGLVGYLADVRLENSYATGNVMADIGDAVGGLVGGAGSTTMTDGYATGSVTVSNEGEASGGLAGGIMSTTITDCYATGNVDNVGGLYIGGLVGANAGIINSSYSTGEVQSTGDAVGGFVGYSDQGSNSIIDNCYSTGNVEGSGDYYGGLVGANGNNEEAFIINSYATGNVTNTNGEDIGGLVGVQGDGLTNNSFYTGYVFGDPSTNNVGGIIAEFANGDLENSYWINHSNDNASTCHDGGEDGCIIINHESYFFDISNSPLNGWSFAPWDNVCDDEGYVPLAWENVTAVTSCRGYTPEIEIYFGPATLDSGNRTYKLVNNINCTGTCLTFEVNNATLNCGEFIINYSTNSQGSGINITDYNSTNIANCRFEQGNSSVDGSSAILLSGVISSSLINNTMVIAGNGSKGILLQEEATYNIIGNNTINITGFDGACGIDVSDFGTNLNEISENEINVPYGYDLCLNFSAYTLLSNQYIENYTMENSLFHVDNRYGGLSHYNERINQTGENLSSDVQITNNSIFVNSTLRPGFNVSSDILFHNLGFSNPRPTVDFEDDGLFEECSEPQCTELSYSFGVFSFNVTGFTTYSSEETPAAAVSTGGGGGRGRRAEAVGGAVEEVVEKVEEKVAEPTVEVEGAPAPIIKIPELSFRNVLWGAAIVLSLLLVFEVVVLKKREVTHPQKVEFWSHSTNKATNHLRKNKKG